MWNKRYAMIEASNPFGLQFQKGKILRIGGKFTVKDLKQKKVEIEYNLG